MIIHQRLATSEFVTLSVREGGVMLHARWVELPTTPTTGFSPGTLQVLSLVTRLRVTTNIVHRADNISFVTRNILSADLLVS